MNSLGDLIATFVGRVIAAVGDGNYRFSETETRTYPTPPSLSIRTKNGSVTVYGEERDDVSVTITRKAREEAALDRVSVVATGGRDEPLHLETEYADRSADVVVELDVAIPADVPVDAVETKNGTVEVRDVVGDARLETKNGTVTAERVDGYLDLRTKNGTVTARDVAGIDRAETKNGTVDLDLDAIRDDVTVSTKSGTVTIHAGTKLDADVTLRTDVGSIDAPALGRSAAGLGANEVTGTLGSGGHRLRAESKVGTVEFGRKV